MDTEISAFFAFEDNAGLTLAGLLACRSSFLPCLPIIMTVAGNPEPGLNKAGKTVPSPKRGSSLLTVAGPLPIFTGFPIMPQGGVTKTDSLAKERNFFQIKIPLHG